VENIPRLVVLEGRPGGTRVKKKHKGSLTAQSLLNSNCTQGNLDTVSVKCPSWTPSSSSNVHVSLKVDGFQVAHFLNRTSRLDWCVVWWGSKRINN
jgi:hypothetical protein